MRYKMFPKSFHSTTGFTLPELMVVTVVVAILGAIALPRLQAFIGRARQGEAKTNLEFIHKLQIMNMTARDEYVAWGTITGTTNITAGGIGYGSGGGCGDTDAGVVAARRLGFRPDNCSELRYRYAVRRHTHDGIDRFHAFAYAPSDANGRIYPACNGEFLGGDTSATARTAATLNHTHDRARNATELAGGMTADGGDLWSITDQKIMQSSDIVTVCSGESATGENIWQGATSGNSNSNSGNSNSNSGNSNSNSGGT